MNRDIILIDDDPRLPAVLCRRLNAIDGVSVAHFPRASEALSGPACPVYAILLDMMLEDEIGIEYVSQLKSHFQPQHLIIITGYASIPTTVQAIKQGATDYLTKPVAFKALLQRLNLASQSNNDEAQLQPMTPAQVQWEHIQQALHDNQGNISATAKALGMHRRTLQRKLQKQSPKRDVD